MFKNGIIYVIDTKKKTLLVGFDTDISEMKKQVYEYRKASEFFKDKLAEMDGTKEIEITVTFTVTNDIDGDDLADQVRDALDDCPYEFIVNS